jgi:hypothetical protein
LEAFAKLASISVHKSCQYAKILFFPFIAAFLACHSSKNYKIAHFGAGGSLRILFFIFSGSFWLG